ncbi:MAG: 2,3-bisphosphoglycerate-independent phosphoglycerate mutase [Anaerofustis stercorihominis]|nr:2,3-bisphosphoglycerate-independent phosphoglycerate mutase [Anaerofustis stercorihominis]
MTNKAFLIILDGYGLAEKCEYNAITNANTPNLDKLFSENPTTTLKCSGMAVGLPEGQMGNSEVGHLNIGAGRVVYQELSRISKSINDGDFFNNEEFLKACDHVKETGGNLHIMGLTSDGGVHSSEKHYKALLELAKLQGLEDRTYIHCFTDGRDTPPKSAAEFIAELEKYMDEINCGKISVISGRYYAMDRDKRYERNKLAYDALVYGEGKKFNSAQELIRQSYSEEITDEFIVPALIQYENGKVYTVNDGDSIIFFNFRPDRARQLTAAFTQNSFDGFEVKAFDNLFYVTMTNYDAEFENVNIAFKPNVIKNTLGEYLSGLGKKQLRIAETEKYAHVTYFFNGGVEDIYPCEDRALIPSPKVASYDLQPEMSAYELTKQLCDKLEEDYDFVLVNYANCDMVGHTGDLSAAQKAVEAVDECVGLIVEKALKEGYKIAITADHGNAEKMREGDNPHTAHTTNPVPLCVISPDVNSLKENGALCDIAPTILELMQIPAPQEFEGTSLI